MDGRFFVPDFHTHILPGIDDGSSSPEESRRMLDLLSGQGVKRAVATPHFYPTKESLKAFLERRKAAVELLSGVVVPGHPEIYLGAEVAYYRGIGISDEIGATCLCGTNVILVEMPYGKWDDRMVEDVIVLKEKNGLFPVLAHIERFFSFMKKKHLKLLVQHGIPMQSNGKAFLAKDTLKKTVELVNAGYIRFIGSDAHDTEVRRPNTGEACRVIREKCGEEILLKMSSYANKMLDTATRIL